jgi:hypothetical protein
MPSTDINYLAVLVAAIVSWGFGALWYSPAMFSKQWLKLTGKKEKDLKNGSKSGYIIAFIGFLLVAYVLAHIIDYAGSTNFVTGMETGLWMWLGFVATTTAINYSFGQRPRDLWVIDAGYFFFCFLISGGLLAIWT